MLGKFNDCKFLALPAPHKLNLMFFKVAQWKTGFVLRLLGFKADRLALIFAHEINGAGAFGEGVNDSSPHISDDFPWSGDFFDVGDPLDGILFIGVVDQSF